MPRLDISLVETGLIPTRSRAKRAILCGLISVDGKIIQKPSHSIKLNSKIEILNEIALKPVGYWKLHAITNLSNVNLFNPTDVVLDLGSSAGGFLEFAAERCKKVYGIEISEEFAPILFDLKQKYPNIDLHIADVFSFDPQTLDQLDLILNDLTLDPAASIKILARFLSALKVGGYIIMSVKQGKSSQENCKKFIQDKLGTLNLELKKFLDIDPDKKEFHLIAIKQ
jgi:23S rRNA (cytidine1920-2'-O)/16S rRNA (cytidine1409-2'-O)-methyltransferase